MSVIDASQQNRIFTLYDENKNTKGEIYLTHKEVLEQIAFDEGVSIDYIKFKSNNLYGLYIDGAIAIKSGLSETKTADVLAEELGHHFTTVGNIIEQNTVDSRKQERRARLWAYNKRIGLSGIINAYQNHCQTQYETAEYLNVSEEFLQDTLECYRQIYGTGIMVDNFFVQFEPNLMVFEYFMI